MAVETIGADGSASAGTDVADGTANAKGSWVELSSSTSADAQGMIVSLRFFGGTGDALVDIGTGGAGAESVVVADLPCHSENDQAMPVYHIPLPISSGTRVAARCQTTGGSASVKVLVYLISTTVNLEDITSVATYGTNAADSGGTEIDPGASTNTKGSWVEITSSLSADVKFVIPMIHNRGNSVRDSAGWLLDIGTGSAGSESVVVADLALMARSAGDVIRPANYPPFPIEIASGTRVAVRAQSTINDATDRLFDFSMVTANGAASGGGSPVIVHTTRVM